MQANGEILRTLIEICHRLYAKGFVVATDGNVSARVGDGRVLTTRTGVNKGMVAHSDLLEVDMEGKPLGGVSSHRPSTEIGMHLFIYSERPDVMAVVHAHPPYATGFAAARQPLDKCFLPEVIAGLGAIPLAEYATPSTTEVPQSLKPYVKISDAVLLANHGLVAYGADLMDAYFKVEKVEQAAHIAFVARLLGGEKPLSGEDVEKLREVSVRSYGKDFSDKISCRTGCPEDEKSVNSSGDENLREFLRKMIKG